MTPSRPSAVSPRPSARPLSRVEGRDKVMGQAQYAYEQPVEGVAYAAAVTSTIAAGEIVEHRRRGRREPSPASSPSSPTRTRRGWPRSTTAS